MFLRHILWRHRPTGLEPFLAEELEYLRASLHARRTPRDRDLIHQHVREIRQLRELMSH